MNYCYRRFKDYEVFETFLKQIAKRKWHLDSWQDIGGNDGIDIRAIFACSSSNLKEIDA